MRKSYGIVLALGVCAVVALLSCDKDETPFSTQSADVFKSTVSGRVTNQSGVALRGALVTALPGGATTVTADSGKFELSLGAGNYRLSVSKDDYRDTTWKDTLKLGLLQKATLDSVKAQYRYATVVGTVLDSTGATLSALYAAGVTVANQSVSTQTTAGSFRLGRIEPGSVSLYAVVSGVGYSTLDTVLKASDTLKNVSLQIRRKGGTVSGTVLSNSGSVVSGATVSAVGGVISTTTSSTGSFTLSTVPSAGSVVLTVATIAGDTQKISGVTAVEASSSNLGSISLGAKANSDSVSGRSGFAFGYVGDSTLTLLGDTTGRDTSFHVHRWLWSGTGLSDSSDASSYRLHIAKLGWGEGDHSVSVRARALDGRASAAGTVTVRILDTLTALHSLKVGSGNLSPGFDSGVASYVDTVAAATTNLIVTPSVRSGSDTIWVNGAVVASGAGGSVAFSADTATIPIVVKNAYTPASRTYGLTLVRRDTIAPVASRRSPTADTTKFAWSDSVTTVKWKVTDDRKLGTLKIDSSVVVPDSQNLVSRAETLSVGARTVKLVATDAWGNVRRDSVVLVRKAKDTTTVDTTYGIPWNDSVSYGVLKDARDGQSYRTVKIGTQNWMAENLNYKVDSSWCYDNSADSCSKYGRLYQWAAAMGLADSCNVRSCSTQVKSVHQGICPSGWHVPDAEWSTLVQYVDSATSGTKLKSTSGWDSSGNGTDIYGFRILPAGIRHYVGMFPNVGYLAVFWSSSEYAASSAWDRNVDYGGNTFVYRNNIDKSYGFSLRCIEGVGTTRSTDTLTTLQSLVVDTTVGKLSPRFDTSVTSYKDTVSSGTTSLVLTPTASSTSDTIRVNGTVVTSGSAYTVTLSADTATIKIVVSSPNTASTHTYTVGVVHKATSTLDTGSFTDSRDGQVYKWAKIGTQKWMARNLNYKVDSSWCYSGSTDSCSKYGRLYQWTAAMNASASYNAMRLGATLPHQGVCPSGWHVPSDAEWTKLTDTILSSSTASATLKATSGWKSGNGTDAYGFSAMPAGIRNNSGDGSFLNIGYLAAFLSASEYNGSYSWIRYLANKGLERIASDSVYDKSSSFSLRCIEGVGTDVSTDTLTTLHSLVVGSGTLSPTFDTLTKTYVDTVSSGTTSLILTPTASSGSDTIKVNGNVVKSGQPDTLSVTKDTTIKVVVSSPNTTTTHTYTVAVVRKASDSIPWNSSITYGSLTDLRDGQVYKTVQVGTQRWMAQNLNYKYSSGGDSGWCVNSGHVMYGEGGAIANCNEFGRLYTWRVAVDSSAISSTAVALVNREGICPRGWHVPVPSEWNTLLTYASKIDSAGKVLKSTKGWASSGNGVDSLGMRVLPSGNRDVMYMSCSGSDSSCAEFWTGKGDSSVYLSATTKLVSIVGSTTGEALRCIENSSDTLTTLRTLVVGSGTLSPTFDSLTTSYTDTIASGVTSLVLTPTASSSSDTIKANGTVMTSGSAYTVALSADTATVTIVINSPNTVSTHTYTVNVVRRAASTSASGWDTTTYGIPWNDTVSTYGTLTDSRDGQVYRTVKIGTQTWMAQNLNYTADSSWCYDNASDSCLKYGRLYKWTAVVGLDDSCNTSTCSTQVAGAQRGICPGGWHVPSAVEWSALVQHVDSASSGTKLKSTNGWTTDDGTDVYGFRVLPTGGRIHQVTSLNVATFLYVGSEAFFWSSSEGDEYAVSTAWSRYVSGAGVERDNGSGSLKENGFSLRCIGD